MYLNCSRDSVSVWSGKPIGSEGLIETSNSSETSTDKSFCALHIYKVVTLVTVAGAIAKGRM
jgi:hypothetical protein